MGDVTRLRRAVERDEYEPDAGAVALAMIARGRALRAARRAALCSASEVLVAPERIEVRRIGSREAHSFPVEGAA
jgi:hypothetical protein